jgi:hypothetical protein
MRGQCRVAILLTDLYADGVAHARSSRTGCGGGATWSRLGRAAHARPAGRLVRDASSRSARPTGTHTIWLADAAADTGGARGHVDVEDWPLVRENLDRAGVSATVDFVLADGGAYLAGLADGSVDLLFLDAERVEYPGWWPHPVRVLRPGGVLAVDNVLSHPAEVAEFLGLVAADGGSSVPPRRSARACTWPGAPIPPPVRSE